MKVHLNNDWKKTVVLMRCFEIIPSLSINFYENYRFESVRMSWLGFDIGFY